MIFLEFAACAVVILIAGTKLSKHADVIAEATGLGKSWVGLLLLATVTSLPELLSSISAVTLNNVPDLAVSGTLGSCMFNMLVIASLDLHSKTRPVSALVQQGHQLSAGFGVVLLALAAIDILFGKYLPSITFLNSIDPMSLLFIVVYLFSMKLIYSYEKTRLQEFIHESAAAITTSQDEKESNGLKTAITWFTVHSIFIVVASLYLPDLAEQIAKQTGWGESFIGSSLIAITTSLPEITVSVAAARMGSFDMAVANLLGSNLFNVAILAITDFFYLKAPLLRSVQQINTLSALTAIVCSGVVIIGLTYQSKKKFYYLAGDAIAIAFFYILANTLLFMVH